MIKEFYQKYKGRKIDFDGAYGAQCVDLFRQYAKECLRFPQTQRVTSAFEIFSKAEKDPITAAYYQIIPKIALLVQSEDIIIFKPTKNNPHGHIGIVLSADYAGFTLVEQDGYTQQGVQLKHYDDSYVMGALRPKKERLLKRPAAKKTSTLVSLLFFF